MWWSLLIDGSIAVSLLAIWYFSWRYWLRKRSRRIVHWIELAFRRHGRIQSIQWLSPSRFQVDLKLRAHAFRHAHLVIQMAPREMPFSWLWYRLKKHQETATFAASLDCPPSFNLDLRNHRWSATCVPPSSKPEKKVWRAERLGQVVITTRRDWQPDIVNMMDAMTASRTYDFLKITYRRQSPHFSPTVALDSMEPDVTAEANVFDVIRELATSSSPSPF